MKNDFYEPYKYFNPFVERGDPPDEEEEQKAYGEIIVPLRLRSRSLSEAKKKANKRK